MSSTMTKSKHDDALLRLALVADAIASGAMGVLMAAGAGLLAPLLGLPQPLLLWAGLALIPFAAFVGWAGLREAPPLGAVRTIVAVNLAWVAGSAMLPALLPTAPSMLGLAFVALQAAAVLALATLQWVGAARAGRAPAHS
jgi:hypothetical protein